MKALIFICLALFSTFAVATEKGLPRADESKPLYQWKGYPPPFNMWFGGKCYIVTVDKELVISQGDKSAEQWQDLAFYTAIAAIIATLTWWFIKTKQVAGAAIILLFISFGCTIMAEIVTHIGLIIGVSVAILFIIGVGFALQNTNVIAWFKARREQRKAAANG